MEEKVIINPYQANPTQFKAHTMPQLYKLFGGARGGGKTVWLVQEAIRLSMRYPGNIGFMARYQLSDFKRTTLQELLKSTPEGLIESHNKSEGFIKFINDSIIHYAGLSDQEGVSKMKSMNLGWYAWDEATEIPYDCFLMVEPAMRHTLPDGTKPPYCRLFATNPRDCWLVDIFFKAGEVEPYTFIDPKTNEKRTVNITTTDNVKGDTVFVPSLPKDNPYLPEGFEENLRKFYPPDYVRVYLEGDWSANLEGLLVIKPEWVSAAINRELMVEDKPVLGCDVARSEQGDETVITYCRGYAMVDQTTLTGSTIPETSGRLIGLSQKYKTKLIAIENDGLGVGVADGVAEARVRHLRVQMGSKPSDVNKDKYYNTRAEVWFNAAKLFEEGLVSIINDPKLIRQLSGILYSYRSNGSIMLEPKEATKSRVGGSPDRADALVLALWAASKVHDPQRDFIRKSALSSRFSESNRNPYGWNYHTNSELAYA